MKHPQIPTILRNLFLVFSLLFSSSLALAQTTWRVGGTVSVVGSNLGSSVMVGDVFQIDFVFDETQSPWADLGTQALYNLQTTTLLIDSTGAGDLVWTRSDPAGNNINHGFSVENGGSRDSLILNGPISGPSLNGKAPSGGYVFTFTDSTMTAFTSTTIPTTPTLESFNQQLLDLRFDGNVSGQDIINFNATSFQVNPSAVPEPSTCTVLVGMMALGFASLRRRRNNP